MGSVGLSFGSASSGQGFDVATTVSQIIANYQQVETPWKTQLTGLQAQDTAFTAIGTDLSTLSTAFSALTDFQGVLASKEGSSSDPTTLALTSAATTAVAGSHTITVGSLAQTSSYYTDALSSPGDTLSGSFSVQVGSGAAQAFTINSSDNTVDTLAAGINAANIGVTASVIGSGSSSRLSIVSGTSGSAGQLTLSGSLTDVTSGSAINFNVGQSGADANLTIDGIQISSPSNTVTDAVPGVTLQLLAPSLPNTQVQVQITNDNGSVATAISNFVSAYNTVANDVTTQEGHDSSGNAEPLFGNTTLSTLQEELSQALDATSSNTGSILDFQSLGITANSDGTLSLNTDTLNNALTNDYQNVVSFLQGASSPGSNFGATLNGLSSTATTGIIYQALQSNQAQETTLNSDITNENSIITEKQTELTAQLNTANQILQEIPSQLNEVNELYSSMTGYNENPA